jgi:hypothetical protein
MLLMYLIKLTYKPLDAAYDGLFVFICRGLWICVRRRKMPVAVRRHRCTFVVLMGLMCMCLILSQNVYATVDSRLALHECIEVGLRYNIDVLLARMDYEEAQAIFERAHIVGEKDLIEESLKVLKDAEERLSSIKRSVAESIEQKFYGLSRAEDALQTEARALERSKMQLEADEIRFQAGTIAVLDIEAGRNDFQSRNETHENSLVDLETQYMELNKLLGLELDAIIELQGEFDFGIINVSFDEAYELALDNRTDIREAREQIEDARVIVRNLDNPYSARIELEKALLEVERRELRLRQKCEAVFFEVRQACLNMERMEKRISRAETSLEFAARRSQVTKLKYEAGMLSTQQFLSAESELFASENAVIQAKWDYHNAKLSYMKAIGMSDLEKLLKEMTTEASLGVEGGDNNV